MLRYQPGPVRILIALVLTSVACVELWALQHPHQPPDTIIIDVGRQCDHCRVRLIPDIDLDPLPREEFGVTKTIAFDGRSYFASAFVAPSVLHRWDSRGRYEGATDGSRSSFRLIRALLAIRDTLIVFDSGRQELMGLLAGGKLIRFGARLTGDIFDVSLPDPQYPTRLVLNGFVPTAESIGYPLHLVERLDFLVLRSFGSDRPVFRLGESPTRLARSITSVPKHPASVWVADPSGSSLEHWNVSGQR